MDIIKHHKIVSAAIGLLFLVVLQSFGAPRPVYRFLAPAFLAYLLVVWLYNRWYLKNIQKYNFWVMIRPILLLVSIFGLYWVIPSFYLKGLFLLAAVAVIVLVEMFLKDFAENILLNETLLIAFSSFLSLFALNQYYPSYNTWYVMGAFVAGGLATRAFYEFVPQSLRFKTVSSLAMALFMAELFWAMAFLPFHYSASALLLFNLFYFGLILNYYYIYNTLSVKKIQFHFVLMALGSLFVLLATPWKAVQ